MVVLSQICDANETSQPSPLPKIHTLLASPPPLRRRSAAMPVKWLMHWQPSPGATLNNQILTEVCQCVESINGAKDGRWKSQLLLYRPASRDGSTGQMSEYPRDVVNLVLHEQPGKCYFVIRGTHRIVFEAEASFLGTFKKLQSYKANAVFTFEGFQYKLGDFQLRVGKCATPESLRGMMMEVEYLPLSSIEKSKQILEDFYDIWQDAVAKKSLPGHFIHIESNFAEYGLQDQYTSQHTALQYATCTTQLLASVRNL